MHLSGPSLDSKTGTVFAEVDVARAREVVVAGHTGMIFQI